MPIKRDKFENEYKISPPDISEQEIDEVIDALKSGWITTGATEDKGVIHAAKTAGRHVPYTEYINKKLTGKQRRLQ